MDYSRSTEMAVGADQLFAYVGNVEKLPQYMPRIVGVQRLEGGRVRVTAKLEGVEGTPDTVTGEAWVKVLPEERRLEWGSEGPNNYHGELVVRPTSRGATIEVRVHTDRVDSDDINGELRRILDRIKDVLEVNR
jgi:hypothetical protein